MEAGLSFGARASKSGIDKGIALAQLRPSFLAGGRTHGDRPANSPGRTFAWPSRRPTCGVAPLSISRGSTLGVPGTANLTEGTPHGIRSSCKRRDARRSRQDGKQGSSPPGEVRLLNFWAADPACVPARRTRRAGVAGPVDAMWTAVLAGAVAGSVIGAAQWLVLRRIGIDARWIAATAVGLGGRPRPRVRDLRLRRARSVTCRSSAR